MKQLQIDLKKRLLIVEVSMFDDYEFINKDSKYLRVGNEEIKLNIPTLSKIELICEGSEFTEEIAKGLVHQSIHTNLFAHYVKDIPVNTYCYKSALEAFISAIESAGYFWGDNPIKLMYTIEYMRNHSIYHNDVSKWEQAQEKTFNPETSIIFEIL